MTDDIVGPPSYQSEESKKKGLEPEYKAIFDSYREQREREFEEALSELRKNRKKLSDLINLVENIMTELEPEIRKKYAEKLGRILL
jgi:hypothetical protein